MVLHSLARTGRRLSSTKRRGVNDTEELEKAKDAVYPKKRKKLQKNPYIFNDPRVNDSIDFIGRVVIIAIFALLVFACKPEQKETETYSYNAFFVYPPGHPKAEKGPVYVGTVTGLSSCKYVTSDYYTKRRKFIGDGWDYICCHRTEENECEAQHRYGED